MRDESHTKHNLLWNLDILELQKIFSSPNIIFCTIMLCSSAISLWCQIMATPGLVCKSGHHRHDFSNIEELRSQISTSVIILLEANKDDEEISSTNTRHIDIRESRTLESIQERFLDENLNVFEKLGHFGRPRFRIQAKNIETGRNRNYMNTEIYYKNPGVKRVVGKAKFK